MHRLLVLVAVTVIAVQGRRFILPQDEEAELERRQLSSEFADDCKQFDTTDPIYRTANGQCNNVAQPNWGAAEIPLERLLQNSYDDGTNLPRLTGTDGNPLPGARTVSTKVHVYDPAIDQDRRWTVMFMQWGQFLDHDITATPLVNSDTAVCCTDDVIAGAQHPDVVSGGPCLPISIPENDAYFGPKDVKCMEFKRSLNKSDTPREQENVITAFIDGSQVYGSSPEEQAALRSGVNGQMQVSNGEHLPEDVDGHCNKILDTDYCLLAGDHRVNVFPGLAALHTVFVRFHNQIATRISETKDWTDEQIFQETRKIVSAVLQHITYNEYIPEVIGVTGAEQYQLNEGNYAYDPAVNPSVYNSFATAAFRYGHSTIVKSLEINGTEIATEDLFLTPYYVLHQLNSLVQTIISNPSAISDRYFVEAITNKLFITETGSLDLIALNIQRGRDHGLPSYNDFREHVCGLSRIRNFDSRVFRDFGHILSEVYTSVDDIDLFTGGVAEARINGGTVGPTFSCIIGKQFHNLKFGDSFWHETTDSRRGFTTAQLAEIKKIFLSRVLCNTVPPFNRIQPFVMIPPRVTGNERRSCAEIADFDLDVLIDHVEPSNQQAEVVPTQTEPRIQRPFRLNQGDRPRNRDRPVSRSLPDNPPDGQQKLLNLLNGENAPPPPPNGPPPPTA